MKILMVNKFFYIKGGSETYYFSLKELLERHGHTVIDFSMKDEKNNSSPYENYFVNPVDYGEKCSIFKKAKMALKIIYSSEAKRKFEQLVLDTRPDIVHLNLFQHQLSPSILSIVKKYKLPVVYTAHDLKMLCPNYKMYTHGQICERCRTGHYANCLRYQCIKDSKIKSFIVVIEAYVHKWLKSYEAIQTVIVPSVFYKKKFIEWGINPDKVIYLPNFLNALEETINAKEQRQYYLYYGRLSEEKGVITLLKAVKGSNIKLYIAGTGPSQEAIQRYINQNALSNIYLKGYMHGHELRELVGNAKAVILPSEWYENSPYTVIEALQLARPIIASDIGGIPELIRENGYIFRHGDANSLKEKIDQLEQLDKENYNKLCKNSLNMYKEHFTSGTYYEAIINIYKNAISKSKLAG